MTSCIHVTLILLPLLGQMCRGNFQYCQEAVESVTSVTSCPTSEEEWKSAVRRKNCTATQQTCSKPETFLYHCVINEYGNKTLEVCAPQRLMTGFCTEFNVGGGVIQSHGLSPCNETAVLRCANVYYSSEAYKYPDCYNKKIITSATSTIFTTTITSQNETTTKTLENRESTIEIVAALVCVAVLGVCLTVIIVIALRRHILRRPENITKHEEEEMTLIKEIGKDNKGQSKEIKVLENVKDESKRYLKYYQKMDKYYVETKMYKEAKKIFVTNGIVIFKGPPGCGKTMAAVHLIGENLHDCTFRKIRSLDELTYIEKDEKSVVFIDNIFFQRTLDLNLENWWERLEQIYNRYFRGNVRELGSDRLRILITARPDVIERACSYMEKVTPILNENLFVDASILTDKEKDEILGRQIEFAKGEKRYQDPKLSTDFKRIIKKSDGPIGFPLCAHLYVCGKEYQKSGAEFFSRPVEYLKFQIKDEIKSDKSYRVKSLFFCLFFNEWHTKMEHFESFQIQNETHCRQCLDKVSRNILPSFEPFDFKELESEAQRLSGAFFKKVGEHTYKFVHDSVYEAVGAYLCETYVLESAKYFPLDIIQHQNYESLSKSEMLTFAARLLYETLDQQLSHVFSCKLFQNRHFADCFCTELQKKDQKTNDRIFSVANKSSIVKLPCLFWTSRYNLTYLTELLYTIVKTRQITPKYQLYVLLYGVCVARRESLLTTINGMLCDNFEMIKKRVLEFKDSEENTILHLLMISAFSDEFATFAMENIINDGMHVHSKNKLRITPSMFAVEQILPRTKVIKCIMKFSEQLVKRDVKGSTILHHCLCSDNTDKTCAEYLKIILEKSAVDALLKKDDLNGDTPLSIAANCSKRSRIQSILILLESNVDIINTLNEDGYSPLHLAVVCFKDTETSSLVELECCIRVIILILFGDSPENKSDEANKAVDECKYDLVKSILQNPKDKTNMEKTLETLLEKLSWKHNNEISEEELIQSEKMTTGIRKCITIAVQHLENVRLDHLL